MKEKGPSLMALLSSPPTVHCAFYLSHCVFRIHVDENKAIIIIIYCNKEVKLRRLKYDLQGGIRIAFGVDYAARGRLFWKRLSTRSLWRRLTQIRNQV